MSEPIAHDVMDVAASIESDIPSRVTGANRVFIRAVIARALMAARLQEREAVVKLIQEDMYTDQDIEDEPTDFRAAYNRALTRQINRIKAKE